MTILQRIFKKYCNKLENLAGIIKFKPSPGFGHEVQHLVNSQQKVDRFQKVSQAELEKQIDNELTSWHNKTITS